jgi:hypothetical protein
MQIGSIEIDIVSRSFRNRGGSKHWPTPEEVPVAMMYAGSRVITCVSVDDRGDGEDRVAGRGVLVELAVDAGLKAQALRVGDLVGGDDERAQPRFPAI